MNGSIKELYEPIKLDISNEEIRLLEEAILTDAQQLMPLTTNLNLVGNTSGIPTYSAGIGTAVSSPDGLYISSGTGWVLANDKISTYGTYDEKVKEVAPHECPRCGAVLKRNTRECEYCRSEFW